MPRILIADDHPLMRRHVRMTLEEKSWEVCAEAATGREAVAMTAAQRPQIVVLDLCMPELNGLDAAREIHNLYPETEILILTMHDVEELMTELSSVGVRDCIEKTDLQQLVIAIERIWRDRSRLAVSSTKGASG